MKAIKTQGVITSISSRQDNSLRLSISTPELQPEEQVEFLKLKNQAMDMLLNPLDYNDPEIVEIDKDAGAKSPSQRLRSVLFVYYAQNKDNTEGFNAWYNKWMEKKIQEIKDLLN